MQNPSSDERGHATIADHRNHHSYRAEQNGRNYMTASNIADNVIYAHESSRLNDDDAVID